MPTHLVNAYAPDALTYDPASNSWTLRSDFSFADHTVQIAFTDDDVYLDGDLGADEVGEDSNQEAIVYDQGGTPIAKGQVYDEEFYAISDGAGGSTIWIERIEIGGQLVGYAVSGPLVPGAAYNQITTGDVFHDEDTDTTVQYSSLHSLECFGPGTRIATPGGEVAVEDLRAGDLILTRDAGPEPLLWAGRQVVRPADIPRRPGLQPIRLCAGPPGRTAAAGGLVVSGNHRLLVGGPLAELYFAEAEVLAPAKAFLGQPGAQIVPVPAAGIVFTHLLFDAHQVIRANGLWVESLLPGYSGNPDLPPATQRAVRRALSCPPEAAAAARRCLRAFEARLLGPLDTVLPADGPPSLPQEPGRMAAAAPLAWSARRRMPCDDPSHADP